MKELIHYVNENQHKKASCELYEGGGGGGGGGEGGGGGGEGGGEAGEPFCLGLIINNFTRFDTPAKEALPYCEEAVNDHVALDANCKEYSQQTDIEKNSFYANCDNCNNPFAPFTFSVSSNGPSSSTRCAE